MQIRFTKKSDLDLLNIIDWIDEAITAWLIYDEIKYRSQILQEHPEIAPVWFGKVRKLVVGHQWKNAYILPYIIRENKIIVLRVLHGRQQWIKKKAA